MAFYSKTSFFIRNASHTLFDWRGPSGKGITTGGDGAAKAAAQGGRRVGQGCDSG